MSNLLQIVNIVDLGGNVQWGKFVCPETLCRQTAFYSLSILSIYAHRKYGSK